MYADRIVGIGNKLQGRLESVLVQGALDYVGCNEESLAFEILCDHICEYDVPITEAEHYEIMQLALDMEFDVEEGPFKFLESLRP